MVLQVQHGLQRFLQKPPAQRIEILRHELIVRFLATALLRQMLAQAQQHQEIVSAAAG